MSGGSRARYAKTNQTVTAAAGLVITPGDGAAGGRYTFDVVCAQSVSLQALAADGTTQRTITTIAAPGGVATGPIEVGQGSVLRVVPASDAAMSFSLAQVN